METKNISSVSP